MAEADDISSIIESISVVSRKDAASIALKLNEWGPANIKNVKQMLDMLHSLPSKKKSISLKRNDSEVARVLQTMQLKLEESENRGVKIEVDTITDGINALAADLREKTSSELVTLWRKLAVGIENINTIKALLQFEQARVIESLLKQHRMSTRELANTFDLTERKVKEFSAFYKFCGEFPGLLFTTYTMGTIIKHQKAIRTRANQDERFLNLLKTQQESVEIRNGSDRDEKMLNRWFEDDLFLCNSQTEFPEQRPAEEADAPGAAAEGFGLSIKVGSSGVRRETAL